MRRHSIQTLAAIAFCSFCAQVRAGSSDGPCLFPTMEVLGRNVPKLTLRKTTDGSSKDEAKPASIGYENPDTGSDYLLLDAALRWEALECRAGSVQFLLVPGFEAHRSKFDANPVKKTASKAEAEIWWGTLRGDEGGAGSSFLPYLKLEFGETRDSIKHKNSSKYGLMVHFASNLAWRPSGWVSWKCNAIPDADGAVVACPLKFRWVPSLGVEYYDSLPVERTGLATIEDINATVSVGRLALEYWPLMVGDRTVAPDARLQLLAEFTHRARLGGDALPEGSATLLTYGLTYYFDAKQAIGIGIEHEDGENPSRNFRDEERTTLSLRLKF